MIDIFVLVITIAAFRVSIQSPDVGFLPSEFYSLDLLVVPLWGLYANMIAQLISQVSSHLIIHYHRKIVGKYQDYKNAQTAISDGGMTFSPTSGYVSGSTKTASLAESKNLLREHRFGRPHRAEDERLVVRSWVNSAVLGCGFCLTLLVVMGMP